MGTGIDMLLGTNRVFSASEGKTLVPLFRTSLYDIRTILVVSNRWSIGDLSRRDIIVSCEAVSMLYPTSQICNGDMGVMTWGPPEAILLRVGSREGKRRRMSWTRRRVKFQSSLNPQKPRSLPPFHKDFHAKG